MQSEFGERDIFSANELFNFWHINDGMSNRATGHWRIHQLTKQGMVQEIKSGWYTMKVKPLFNPLPDRQQLTIEKIIQQNYRQITYCTWNVNWLNEFSVHQFPLDNPVIEVEKELLESLKGRLEDNGFIDLGWQVGPHSAKLREIKNAIYILPLPSRAPLRRQAHASFDLRIPTIEKVLVDFFTGSDIFLHLYGSELLHAFSHAVEHYAINYSTLFAYANRRYKNTDIKNFLEKYFPHLYTLIFS